MLHFTNKTSPHLNKAVNDQKSGECTRIFHRTNRQLGNPNNELHDQNTPRKHDTKTWEKNQTGYPLNLQGNLASRRSGRSSALRGAQGSIRGTFRTLRTLPHQFKLSQPQPCERPNPSPRTPMSLNPKTTPTSGG